MPPRRRAQKKGPPTGWRDRNRQSGFGIGPESAPPTSKESKPNIKSTTSYRRVDPLLLDFLGFPPPTVEAGSRFALPAGGYPVAGTNPADHPLDALCRPTGILGGFRTSAISPERLPWRIRCRLLRAPRQDAGTSPSRPPKQWGEPRDPNMPPYLPNKDC